MYAPPAAQEFILPPLPSRGEGATLWHSRGEGNADPASVRTNLLEEKLQSL